MIATISFNFASMKEYINIGNKSFSSNIGSAFLDILSLDTNYIKNEIINKIDFNNIESVKKAYKKIVNIQPLLFIDEFNLIKYINNFNNSDKITSEYDHSIFQLQTLINCQRNIDEHSLILEDLENNLEYLNKRKKTYLKISKNLPKYVNNIFQLILNKIELYRSIVEICYLDSSNYFINNITGLSPLKKYAYYTTFEFKDNNIFKDLPPSNILFSFELLTKGIDDNLKKLVENNPKKAIETLLKKDISPIYEYKCTTLEQFLQISFFTCLTQNLNIKKCENCKRYFITYQRSDEKYCSRISPQDKNKTCKQYSNSENWKKNINSNEELKLYRRIYMSKQMKSRRNPDDLFLKSDFETWKKNAHNKRASYVNGEITKEDFIQWLNNNK